jgi:hypothetical protein
MCGGLELSALTRANLGEEVSTLPLGQGGMTAIGRRDIVEL